MLGICAALQWEVRAVLRGLRDVRRERGGHEPVWIGRCGDLPIVVFRTGIGIDRARAATREALDRFPVTRLANTGCAGALDPSLHTGDLVLADRMIGPGNLRYDIEPSFLQALAHAAARKSLPVKTASVLTSERAIPDPLAKRRAQECSRCVAVEMEGTAVAEAAAARGVPIASVRAILDELDADVSGIDGLVEPDGRLRPWKAAARVLRRPGLAPQLIRLAEAAARAERALSLLWKSFLETETGRRADAGK